MSKQKTIFVHNMLSTCIFFWNSMNNFSSYCGLTDSRMRASDTDLPVDVKVPKNKIGPTETVSFSLCYLNIAKDR